MLEVRSIDQLHACPNSDHVHVHERDGMYRILLVQPNSFHHNRI